ncbi:YggT family protein [Sinomonas cellulolyticus]|jgi:YggT family protein|uniref:YggT family protein n=1 Tax=Sinomonas cellulolyticus TaxID=2801916 RepID=A0ABS1K1E1_9MICC|nr:MULTISPECIES: YggT family protein [Sinomonas]MBL0705494.1 YggT family protein [Sinomonas cellulolyticus]GHG41464.1 YggT family protein [Sinomonas sp. KCTC 49339]
MGFLFAILYLVLELFFIALVARLVFDWIQSFARSWRPRGAALVAASAVYSMTDPPMKLSRRWFKPLHLGAMSLDLAFIVLVIVVVIAMAVVQNLA